MNIKTTFINRDDFLTEISSEIEKIESMYSKMDFILHEDLYPLKKDSYHFIGKLLKMIAPTSREIRSFVANLFKTCFQAETISAGAANLALLYGLSLSKQIIKNPLDNSSALEARKEFNALMSLYKKAIEKNSSPAEETDLKNTILKSCDREPVLTEVIWQAINLAGLEGKIFVEDGRQENYIVELCEGYNFNLKPFKFMIEGFWDRKNCKALIVDGLVEKVSEIDHLLTKSLETKIPMIIFAHGFSEEVVATLKANQEKGLLDIQPVRIPSDIDSLNVANDISIVCGCLPVSSMKGDLILFQKYEDIKTVDRVRLTENECSIENSKTRAAVAAQVKSILEKRQSYFLHEEVQELFDKRMKSLVSNSVSIHLPNSSAIKNDERRVKIDTSLRQCKTILNYGTVNIIDVIDQTLMEAKQNIFSDTGLVFIRTLENFKKSCRQEDIKHCPAISAYIGPNLSGQTTLTTLLSAGFVKITAPSNIEGQTKS